MNTQFLPRLKSIISVFVVLCAMIAMQCTALSQSFQTFGLDASKYPTISLEYITLQQNGTPYANVQTSDFRVFENNVLIPANLVTKRCSTRVGEAPFDAVIVLDKSASMLESVDSTGDNRWAWVKSAVTSFIEKCTFTPPGLVALTSFNASSTLDADFTNDPNVLIRALNRIQPSGNTIYNPAILDSNSGAIPLLMQRRQRGSTARPIIIFLTDGEPADNPPTLTNEIIQKLKDNGIIFYAITVGLPMNIHLQRMAMESGGQSFEAKTRGQLQTIYDIIVQQTQQTERCFLEYPSQPFCDGGNTIRNVRIEFTRTNPWLISTSGRYTAPASSVAKVDVSESNVYMGDPNPSQSTTKVITFTARNAPFTFTAPPVIVGATDFTISNMDGRNYPFTLQVGQVWAPTFQFTQSRNPKDYRQATFQFRGSPCPPQLTMFGGLGKILVINPNTDTTFSICNEIEIQWSGVDSATVVDLFYTLDGNNPNPTWVPIATNRTGFKYRWTAPQLGLTYRIRAATKSAASYKWVRSFGGTSGDSTKGLVVATNGTYSICAGTFTNSMVVQLSNGRDTTISPDPAIGGNLDGFVAKYDNDGNLLWIRTVAGRQNERVTSIVMDPNGDVYVGGEFTSTSVQFGTTELTRTGVATSNGFVAKYNSTSGNAVYVTQFRGNNTTTAFSCSIDDIAFVDVPNSSNDRIQVWGRFSGTMVVVPDGTTPHFTSLPITNFFAFLNINTGALISTPTFRNNNSSPAINKPTYPSGGPSYFTRTTWVDNNLLTYSVGQFSGTLTSTPPNIITPSRGGDDGFLRIFGGTPTSSDSSDFTFKVSAPQISFSDVEFDIGAIALGQSVSRTFTRRFQNRGNIRVILNITLSSPDGAAFSIVSPGSNNIIVEPGEFVNFEILFTPTRVGSHTCTMTAVGNCGGDATIIVRGDGLEPCKITPTSSINFGSVGVGSNRNLPGVLNFLRNEGSVPVSGTVELRTSSMQAGECSIDLVNSAGGSPITLTIGGAPQPYSLAPNATYTADVRFSPTTSGTKQAQVYFTTENDKCGTAVVNIGGFSQPPKITITNLDYGQQRIGAGYNGSVTLMNEDTVQAQVANIVFENAVDLVHISRPGFPTGARTLNPGDTLNIPVQFLPIAKGVFTNAILVNVLGFTQPLRGSLRGEGIRPEITAPDVVFTAATVGVLSAETQMLRISNPDTTTTLTISSLQFVKGASSAFRFDTPVNTPFTIAKSSFVDIPVRFTPSIPGNNTDIINIESDASDSPVNTNLTRVNVSGIGLQFNITNPTDFGTVVYCDTLSTRTIRVNNPSSIPLDIQVVLAGDVNEFEVVPSTSFTLAPGGTRDVVVRWRSGTQASHNLTLNLNTSAGNFQKIFTVNGVPQNLQTQAATAITTMSIGNSNLVSYRFSTNEITNVPINRLTVQLRYPSYINFNQAIFQTTQGEWNWVPTVLSGGTTLELVGTTLGAGIRNGADVTLEVPLNAYLTSDSVVIIRQSIINNPFSCLRFVDTEQRINRQAICYSTGRAVNIGAANGMEIVPNPAPDMATLRYSMAFDALCTIEIYNTMGSLVKTIVNGQIRKSGYVEEPLSLNDLSSGVYMVRMIAGSSTHTQKLVIAK